MKRIYILLVLMVILGTSAQISSADSCFGSGCHGESSDQPCAHEVYDHTSMSYSTCCDCHRDSTSCTEVVVTSEATSESSSSGFLWDIVDMSAIKDSAMDSWNDFNESTGLGTKLFGIMLAAVIGIAFFQMLIGTGIGMFGRKKSDSGQTNEGHSMVINVILSIGILLCGLFILGVVVDAL